MTFWRMFRELGGGQAGESEEYSSLKDVATLQQGLAPEAVDEEQDEDWSACHLDYAKNA